MPLKNIFKKINNHSLTSKYHIRGMSIVELMVGMAIGLFILAGASATFVTNVTNSRAILLESRINQDLRTTMDLIVRDLRRGAYWGNSLAGTSTNTGGLAGVTNPYAAVTSNNNIQINYAYSTDSTENNILDSTNEQFGFQLDTSAHAIKMRVGGSWQTLTNTDLVTIPNNGFTITPTETMIDIRAACAKPCTDTTSSPTCPRVQVRTYNIVLTGIAKSNSAVSRTLESQVRVRNDAVFGVCPA